VKRKLTPRTLGVIVCAVILVYAAAGYFMVVSPKKATSARHSCGWMREPTRDSLSG